MKTIFAGLLLTLTALTSCGEDKNPDDYPSCASIAVNPGTDENAYCADGDEVIQVKNYEHWPR